MKSDLHVCVYFYFVLGGLNSIELGVDQVLWSIVSQFLAPVGWFCLQVSFWYSL